MVHTTRAAVVSAAVLLCLLCLVCNLDGVASATCVYDAPIKMNSTTTKSYDLTSLGEEITSKKQSFLGWGGDPNKPKANYTYLQSFCVPQPEGTCGCKSGAASCQINNDNKSSCNGILSSVTPLAINFVTWNHVDPSTEGFVLWFQGGVSGCSGNRSTQVLLKCGSTNGFDGAVVQATTANGWPNDQGCLYLVQFRTPLVCTSGGFGAGWVIVIIILCLLLLYLIVGAIYNWRVKKATGTQIIPNFDFWKQFPHYVKDGFLFAYYKLTCKKGEYQPLPS